MKMQITGKNLSITPAIREKIESKINFLDRYFIIDESVEAIVVCEVEPRRQKIEVTIPTKFAILRAEEVDEDLYTAIDKVLYKLEDQIRRQKTRLDRRHREKLADIFLDQEVDTEPEELVRTKTINVDVMDLDEAILRMEMLGHSFFVYCDDETNNVAVVYKRNSGGYGLIETTKY